MERLRRLPAEIGGPIPIFGVQMIRPKTTFKPLFSRITEQPIFFTAKEREIKRLRIGLPIDSIKVVEELRRQLLTLGIAIFGVARVARVRVGRHFYLAGRAGILEILT